MISCCVFITKGPRAAMGSSSGSPPSSSTSVLGSVALRRSVLPPRCMSATPCCSTGALDSPTVMPPRRTNTMVLWPSGMGTSKHTPGVAMRMSSSSTGECTNAAPACPNCSAAPAMTRMVFSPPPPILAASAGSAGARGTTGMSLPRMAWYLGASILFFLGRLSHSCAISKVPPACWNSVEWNSSWMMPRAAVIHCTSPGPITSRLPMLSACSTSPWNAMVTVSKPRCGCCPTPRFSYPALNSLGAA
mmetsp:Transcript_12188/g.29469  ORF Transcript_12188/g.29469 Transcript_12188/m.29469 type:complete len:247 (+) Transcript_12188:176-916(+)